jgi:PilZ domain
MTENDLETVAHAVTRRAQRQGFVLAREIREELEQAGLSEGLWKDVLALARSSLRYRQGRYHYVPAVSQRLREEQRHQRAVRTIIRQLIRHYKKSASHLDRRRQDRIDYLQQVKVLTEDDRELGLLSRDLSPNGIRLIGTRSLLGQKVRVLMPQPDGDEPWCFTVRVLWTCAVGDGLFENGGTFLEVT